MDCSRRYDRDQFGNEVYPRRKGGRGSEYYLRRAGYAVDRTGTPRYARDAEGNEIYPDREPRLLEHSVWKYPVYARDRFGNETYPVDRGREMFASLRDGEMLPARFASGRQRYPSDKKGNDYFPLCKITGKPYYLLDEKGFAYKPLTKNGFEMFLSPEESEAIVLHEKTDALGSKYYTEDSESSSIFFGCCI